MYKVLSGFFDLQDNKHWYPLGASYPREGLTVKAERIEELSTANNKMGFPLIKKVEEKTEEKPKTTRKKVKEHAD